MPKYGEKLILVPKCHTQQGNFLVLKKIFGVTVVIIFLQSPVPVLILRKFHSQTFWNFRNFSNFFKIELPENVSKNFAWEVWIHLVITEHNFEALYSKEFRSTNSKISLKFSGVFCRYASGRPFIGKCWNEPMDEQVTCWELKNNFSWLILGTIKLGKSIKFYSSC